MILITGGMGFIGLHVARELVRTDEVVLGYNRSVRNPEELAELVGLPVQAEQIDITSPYSVMRAMAKWRPRSIVHLAVPKLNAMPPAEETMTNVSGLMNVLEAARNCGVERVTAASSMAVYGGIETGPFREDQPLPVTSSMSTAAMKKAEEILALHYADRTGLDIALLRIGITYGPLYQTLANPAGRLTYYAVNGRLPAGLKLHWPADQLRDGFDICHVYDCARAIALTHNAQRHQRIYNIGAGRAVAIGEIIAAVNKAVPDASLPALPSTPITSQDSRAYMDTGRIEGELGFRPELSIEDGIAAYASWLANHPL
jgi:UDP-glucose 4-epimerase